MKNTRRWELDPQPSEQNTKNRKNRQAPASQRVI